MDLSGLCSRLSRTKETPRRQDLKKLVRNRQMLGGSESWEDGEGTADEKTAQVEVQRQESTRTDHGLGQ